MQNYSQKPRKKKWVIREEALGVDPARETALVEDIGVSPCMARLLCLRGYDEPATARDFLYVQTEKLCDTALLADIVPANMVCTTSLLYNQHADLTRFTHAQLALLTHFEIREEVLPDGE